MEEAGIDPEEGGIDPEEAESDLEEVGSDTEKGGSDDVDEGSDLSDLSDEDETMIRLSDWEHEFEDQYSEDGDSGEDKDEDRKVEEEEEHRIMKMINLQKNLTLSVTNIQIAADAKDLEQRKGWEEARCIRVENLEKDVKSSEDKCEEIMKGWSIFDQRMVPEDIRTSLNSQKQLCAAILEDKDKLISNLQQELKKRNMVYVKNLKSYAERIDLMIERMGDQIKTLNKAYREELAEMERAHLEEIEILLSEDKTKVERDLKDLWDKELERLVKRRQTVEEYEEKLRCMIRSNKYQQCALRKQPIIKLQEDQIKKKKWRADLLAAHSQEKAASDSEHLTDITLLEMKRRITRSQKELARLKRVIAAQVEGFTKTMKQLSRENMQHLRRYDRLQKHAKHFELADSRQFKEVWHTIDKEVKQLVGKAVELDSVICRHHLGLDWEPPPMPFMEISGPIMSYEGHQVFWTDAASKRSHRGMSFLAVLGPETEKVSVQVEVHTGVTTVQSKSGTEVKLSTEALQSVMELLCDESGFLIEDYLLKLLSPLEEDEVPGVKHASLLNTLGLEDKDVPKLAAFLLKYSWKQREEREDVWGSDDTEEAERSQLMDRNDVLLALKSFFEQQGSTPPEQTGFWHVETYDAPQAKAYWETMASIIPKDKLKLLDESTITLRKYQAVLTHIGELTPETERLEQENAELRTLLHQRLSGGVAKEASGGMDLPHLPHGPSPRC